MTLIERGHTRILAPNGQELLLPLDRLFLIGNEGQLEAAQKLIESSAIEHTSEPLEKFGLEYVILDEKSPYAHKEIKNCNLRETIQGLIVGIERNNQRILNPDSSFNLLPGDLIWIVGDRNLIKKMK